MTRRFLDGTRSSVRIHTFAEGLLARLAHDLELHCSGAEGWLEGDAARMTAPLAGISVGGVLGRRGVVDAAALSAAERRDILEKMIREVFHLTSPDGAVTVDASRAGPVVNVRLTAPNGSVATTTTTPLESDEPPGRRLRGEAHVSLASLGASVVRGPMGAFRVKDRLTVHYDLFFAAPPP